MGYQRNQISCIHCRTLKWNLMSQIAELFRRPRTMLKILDFSGDRQLFQKSQGIKFLDKRDRKFFHLLVGETKFETEEARSAKLSTGEVTGAHIAGELGQGVSKSLELERFRTNSSINFLYVTCDNADSQVLDKNAMKSTILLKF